MYREIAFSHQDFQDGLKSGCVIDHYRIVKEVGKGYFGTVFEAQDLLK